MDNNISEAKQYATKNGEVVLFSGIIQEISRSDNAQDLILVISQNNLYVFNSNPFSFITKHPWRTLTKISHSSHNVQFQFNSSKYVCISMEIKEIVKALSQALPTSLSSDELVKIGFAETQKESILPKLTLFGLKENINLSESSKIIFDEISQSHRSTVSLEEFSDPAEAIPFLLESFSSLPFLRSVSFNQFNNNNIYRELQPLFSKKNSIECLRINGKAQQSSFRHFLKEYRDCDDSLIQSFIFANSEFGEEHLKWLKELFIKKQLRSLGFQNAFNSKSTKFFYTSFLNSEIGDKLTYLNLDETKGIRVSLILPNLPQIQYLSLENCELDLCDTLSKISRFRLPKLVALNLSGSICANSVGLSKLTFPASLESLMVNGIKWEGDSLLQMFTLIFNNFENGIRFSISSAAASEEQWNNLFLYLQTAKYNKICSLVWNRNPVNPVFVDFLRENASLSYLSMDSCFTDRDKSTIDQLMKFVAESNILSLSLRGSKHHCLGSLITNVLKYELNLDFLDITGNSSGSYIIEAADFLAQSRIGVLVLDGNFTSSNALKMHDFFERIINNGTKVSCPIEDIKKLREKRNISEEKAKEMKELFIKDYLYIEEEEPSFVTYIKNDDVSNVNNKEVNNDAKDENNGSRSKRLFEMNCSSPVLNVKKRAVEDEYSSDCIIISDDNSDDYARRRKPHVNLSIEPNIRLGEQNRGRRRQKRSDIYASTGVFNKEPEVEFIEQISPRKRNSSVPQEMRISFALPESEEKVSNDSYEIEKSAVATVGDPLTLGIEPQEKEIEFRQSPIPIPRPSRVNAIRKHILTFVDSGSDHFEVDEEEDQFHELIVDEDASNQNKSDSESTSDQNMRTMMIFEEKKEEDKTPPKKSRRRKRESKDSNEEKKKNDKNAEGFIWNFPIENDHFNGFIEEIWDDLNDELSLENVFESFSKVPTYKKK